MEKLIPGLLWVLFFPPCTCYGRNLVGKTPRLKAQIVHVCGFVRGSARRASLLFVPAASEGSRGCCFCPELVPSRPKAPPNARSTTSERFVRVSSCGGSRRSWGRCWQTLLGWDGPLPQPSRLQLCASLLGLVRTLEAEKLPAAAGAAESLSC